MMRINTVTVIGVTGTMGAEVAGIFASFGNAKVYAVGRDIEKVKSTIPRIVKSVRADCIAEKLVPADFSMLEQCVSESDLVFESAVEDLAVKSEIAARIAKSLKPGAIACTGTSGLSVKILADCFPEHLRGHFFGVHMFNPPYSMSLCELIPTPYSDRDLMLELRAYLESVLFRTVVEVKDSPAFLANRIGFQFINEALQYAEKYKDYGGIDYIDSIIGPFTGRTMPPLVTADFVGLDVHKAIVDNVYRNTSDYARDTFILPAFAEKLVAENKLGRKTGGGLYRSINSENGQKHKMVFDITTGEYRDQIPYVFPFAVSMKEYISDGDYSKAIETLVKNRSQEADMCLMFMLKYILYSLYAAGEVSFSVHSADDVMASGFNWCPPLAMYQALSVIADVKALVKDRLPDMCGKVDVERLFAEVEASGYDYRPYFKSAR